MLRKLSFEKFGHNLDTIHTSSADSLQPKEIFPRPGGVKQGEDNA